MPRITDSVKPWVRRAVWDTKNKIVEERRRGKASRRDVPSRRRFSTHSSTFLFLYSFSFRSMSTKIALGACRNTTRSSVRWMTILTGGPLPLPRPLLPARYQTMTSRPPRSTRTTSYPCFTRTSLVTTKARSLVTAYFFGPLPPATSRATVAAIVVTLMGPSVRGCSLQQQLRDRVQLHVARALVDRADLRVPVELLHRVLLRVSVAAEQLDGK